MKLRYFRIASLSIGGVILAGIVLLQTPMAKRYALQQLQRELAKQGITFSASNFNYNVLSLSASLTDVVVQPSPGLAPLLRVGALTVDASLWSLMRGYVVVTNATMTKPEIFLLIDAAGKSNLPVLSSSPSSSKSSSSVLIDFASIDRASFRYEDRRSKTKLFVPDWQMTIDGDRLTDRHAIHVSSNRPVTAEMQARSILIDRIQASLDLGKDDVRVNGLNLISGATEIHASGTLKDFTEPVLDLAATSRVDLKLLEPEASGGVDLGVRARGAFAALQVSGSLNGRQLRYRNYERADLSGGFAYDAAANRARLFNTRFASALGNATVDVDAALTAAAGSSNVNVALDRVRLDTASRLAKSQTIVASSLSGTVRARFPGLEWDGANAEANLRLQALGNPGRNVIPVGGFALGTWKDGAGTVRLRGVRALGSAIDGDIRVARNQSLGGTLRGGAADIADTIRAFTAYSGKKVDLPKLEGAANVTVALAGTVKQPTAEIDLTAPSLTVGELTGVAGEIQLNYDPRVLEVRNATVRYREQVLSAAGTVNLRDNRLALESRLENTTIESLLQAAGKTDVPVSGNVGIVANIGGTTQRPEVDAKVKATNVVAYQEPVESLELNAKLRSAPSGDLSVDGRLDVVKAPGETLTAVALYGIDTKVLTADAKSTPLKIRALNIPGYGLVKGSIELSAQSSGSADLPEVEAKVNAKDIVVGATSLGDLDANLNLANQVAKVELNAPKQNLKATAQGEIAAPYALTFNVSASNTDLASLPLPAGSPVSGIVSAAVQGSLKAEDWKSIEATLRAERMDLKVNNEPISLTAPLEASIAKGLVTIQSASIAGAGTNLEVKGSIPIDIQQGGKGEVTVAGKADLATASKLFLDPQTGGNATGVLELNGTIRGNLEQIEPNLTVSIADGFFKHPSVAPVTQVNLQAQAHDGRVDVASLSANWSNAAIEAKGSVPFNFANPGVSSPATLDAKVTGLDLSQLTGMQSGVTGKVSVELKASAPRPALDAISGTLSFPTLEAGYSPIQLTQDGISTIRFGGGTATVERFRVTGPQTEIALSGSATYLGTPVFDAALKGSGDLSLLRVFAPDLRAQGKSRFEVAAKGTAAAPQLNGFLALDDAQIANRSPRIAAENLNFRADLAGQQVTISKLSGSLNGGTLSGGGNLRWSANGIENSTLSLVSKEVYLDFPDNFRTVSDLDLKFQTTAGRSVLGGSATITRGSYTEPLNLDQGLFNVLNRTPEVDLTEERNPFLEKLSFDLGIKSQEPLVVDNNLAKAEIEIDTRVRGTYYAPGLTGRVTVLEGGELNLNEKQYLVQRGVITFVNEQRVEPVFDLEAKTQAAGYDITLAVQGGGRDRTTTITSDPPLAEPDIISVLLTGRTVEGLQGQETDVAREQVLSYLTGRVGGSLSRGLERATGISQVRIEPNLIANESDPSARLTIGQNLTRQLSLIYSVNLVDSGDQIIVGQYELARRLRTRALKQSDNSYRFDFSQQREFGGEAPPPKSTAERERKKVGDVRFSGATVFSPEQLEKWLKARRGKQYDFFAVRKGLDKIEDRYAKEGLLESRIRLRRDDQGPAVDLDVSIVPGPKVDFVFEGYDVSRALRNRVRDTWRAGVFDTQRGEDAVQDIRNAMIADGFVEGKVDYAIDLTDLTRKRVTFDIQPGDKFGERKLIFAGATKVPEQELRQIVKDKKLVSAAITDPSKVIDLVTSYYRERGFLDAKLANPDLVLDRDKRIAQSVFPVAEGPEYLVNELAFDGNAVFNSAQLSAASALFVGEAYTPVGREDSVTRLRDLYSGKGYNETEVGYALEKVTPGQLRVRFRITEGQQSIVQDVQVSGNRETGGNFVKQQLELKPGDPLDSHALSRSRKNLYTTGAFALVDIDRNTLPAGSNLGLNQKPVSLAVNVREIRPFSINYGGYFDTDRGPGGILELANRNSLGAARTLGMRIRYDSDLQEARLFFTQPLLRSFPLRTTISTFVRREIREGFKTDRTGVSLLQEARFRDLWILNYGYRIENTRTYEDIPDPLFDVKLRVAPFTSSLSRDSRDEILDATRGNFISHAVEYAPSWAGGELNYAKYFGQYFYYKGFGKAKPMPFQNGVRRQRIVYAGGVRAGFAAGFGDQNLIPGRSSNGRVSLGERFFAGGGTTVRGFEQDGIGPRLFDNVSPAGGDSLFIVNQEIRFPLYKFIDGVGFGDFGNVYDRIADFKPWEVRKVGGFGIRIRTPYFLVRFDYGVKLDRKPGEPLARPFFSIGQAF